ncbi:chaperone modulator CbpM [Spirosoma flavum]|uniref:Chaperone modulator CbpM n=1 Tax=Spirosoma flavum TaxID=2048557 RepID=A0ABW6ATX5_9BACT
MQPNNLIPVSEFCVYHHIEITFVHSLEQRGLVETITIERSVYVQPEQLARLEKLVRLHQELAIHPDDLDVVTDLLDRVEGLQHQVTQLQNQLVFYKQVDN